MGKGEESDVYFDKYLNLDLYDLEILNDKEKELFDYIRETILTVLNCLCRSVVYY